MSPEILEALLAIAGLETDVSEDQGIYEVVAVYEGRTVRVRFDEVMFDRAPDHIVVGLLALELRDLMEN